MVILRRSLPEYKARRSLDMPFPAWIIKTTHSKSDQLSEQNLSNEHLAPYPGGLDKRMPCSVINLVARPLYISEAHSQGASGFRTRTFDKQLLATLKKWKGGEGRSPFSSWA